MYEQLEKYIGELIGYKAMCEECGVKYYSGGKAKQLQLEDMGRYYIMEKVKSKYKIVGRRDIPLEKVDKRKETDGNNTKYADDIETIMLYTLQNKKEFVCTISQALLLCNLINENYSVGRKEIPLTSKILNLDIKNVYMFYDNTSRRLKDTFERALNRMRGKALLSYTKPIRVAYNDVTIELNDIGEPRLDSKNKLSYSVKEVHRNATDEEIEVILKCESDALEFMGCIDKQQVFLSHRWNEFRDVVTKDVSSRLNVKYYYEAYKITVNKEHVNRTIKRYEANGSSSMLNYTILESLLNSIDKADNTLGDDGVRKYSEKFISDTKVMIDTTINTETNILLSDMIKRHKNSNVVFECENELPF